MTSLLKLTLALTCLVTLASCANQSLLAPRQKINPYATYYLGTDGRIHSTTSPKIAILPPPSQTTTSSLQPAGFWVGDSLSGPPSIIIDLSNQEARFYKGEKLAGISPVSTGREGYRTPSGHFKIIQKNADHFSNLYGDYVDSAGNVVVPNVGVHRDPRPPGTRFRGAPMPYFMRIHGAVGLHGGYLPGYPDSHGCIRLPMNMAQIFFSNAPLGTPVSVIP